MVSEKKYDIVVFGASGFTGQYVVDEVAKTADEVPGLKWAVAGRNWNRCKSFLEKSAKRTGIL